MLHLQFLLDYVDDICTPRRTYCYTLSRIQLYRNRSPGHSDNFTCLNAGAHLVAVLYQREDLLQNKLYNLKCRAAQTSMKGTQLPRQGPNPAHQLLTSGMHVPLQFLCGREYSTATISQEGRIIHTDHEH
eukprot:g21276.t1